MFFSEEFGMPLQLPEGLSEELNEEQLLTIKMQRTRCKPVLLLSHWAAAPLILGVRGEVMNGGWWISHKTRITA